MEEDDQLQGTLDYLESDMGTENRNALPSALEQENGIVDYDRGQVPLKSAVPELEEAEIAEMKPSSVPGNERLVIVDDPYTAGQCTTRVTLVISPEDGHEQGPLVFIAASTHEDLPGTFLTCRMKELVLPPQILVAITSAHETLSQRGEEKQAALQLAAQKQREANEKEQHRKQKKQKQSRKEAEKKKAEEKRALEPQITDMFEALS